MSRDAEVQEVIELIKALNFQQTALISRLERLSAEREERRTTATPRAVPTVIGPRAYQIGDEVRILNPCILQPSAKRKDHQDQCHKDHSESTEQVHNSESTQKQHSSGA